MVIMVKVIIVKVIKVIMIIMFIMIILFIGINIGVFTHPAFIVELGGQADRQTPSSEMRETPGISTVFFPVKIFQRGSSPLGNHYKQKPLICSSPMNTF